MHNGTRVYNTWPDFVKLDADIKIISSCHDSEPELEERTSLLGHYKYCKKCDALKASRSISLAELSLLKRQHASEREERSAMSASAANIMRVTPNCQHLDTI